MNNSPIISVVMITYGHELYIKQAILSILMQKCEVEFELIIVNDCSPDNTDDIVYEIIDNHPFGKYIKYIKHKINKGVAKNFAWAMEQSIGRYIALCEGDDLWTDPNKLQMQLNFLESHPSFSMSCHSTSEIDEDGKVLKVATRKENTIDLDLVLEQGWFIRTASMFFRKEIIDAGFPNFYYTAYSTDYILQIMALKEGNCKCFLENMASYRHHEGGFSKSSKEIQVKRWLKKISLLSKLDNYTEHLFAKQIKTQQKNIKRNISFFLVRHPYLVRVLGLNFYFKNFYGLLFLREIIRRLFIRLNTNLPFNV